MNEIQLIRGQLSAERMHASAVAGACAVAARSTREERFRGEFAQACVDYLVRVLAWFEERDQRAGDLARGRPGEAASAGALEEALSRPGRSREALEKLERAVAAGSAAAAVDASGLWEDFARYFDGTWSARRDAIDARLAEVLRPVEWRIVAGIDADSILEERRRFARVRAALPAGVALGAPAVVVPAVVPAAR
jgi:hypothetical protein